MSHCDPLFSFLFELLPTHTGSMQREVGLVLRALVEGQKNLTESGSKAQLSSFYPLTET